MMLEDLERIEKSFSLRLALSRLILIRLDKILRLMLADLAIIAGLTQSMANEPVMLTARVSKMMAAKSTANLRQIGHARPFMIPPIMEMPVSMALLYLPTLA